MIPIRKEVELQSGDLILCRGNSFISYVLEWLGQSKYSHVGIILKNPKFINETLEDGLYLWDASYGMTPDVEDQQIRYGVQIHKLDDIIKLYPKNSIYVRKITANRDELFHQQMKQIHETVHAKPYNLHIMDWIAAKENMTHPYPSSSLWKQTDRFWCSSLVSYIYVKLGWISEINWTLVSPREFSNDSTGQILFTCILSDEELLI